MNPGVKHHSRFGNGDTVFHKVTGDRGMITTVHFVAGATASYSVVFGDGRGGDECLEIELTDEKPFEKTEA